MKNTMLALLGFMLLSTPMAATAQQYIFDDFYYTVDDSFAIAITISGYFGPGGSVTIPSTIYNIAWDEVLPVTAIGDYAFESFTTLTNVAIPDGVDTIGQEAFLGTGLTSVTLPDSVGSIGVAAFYDCPNLARVTIP